MSSKRLMSVLGLIVVLSMVLAACGPTAEPPGTIVQTVVNTVEVGVEQTVVVEKTVVAQQTVVVEVTPVPPPVTRTGAWVDQVVFTEQNSKDAAVSQLQADDLDVYAYSVSGPSLLETVKADPNLQYLNQYGSSNEITFNPAVFTDTTQLNPFSNAKIREAMNYAVDRNYIGQEVMQGAGVPRFFCMNTAFPDYANMVEKAAELQNKYAFNIDKAKEIINTEMVAMGAALGADGKWTFGGNPIVLKFIMRTEDERKDIGDYVANQLEAVGFTVDRQYKTRSEASPIWVGSNPTEGLWNLYTGGWITTAVVRDEGSNFNFYYTPDQYPIPLFQAYTPSPEFYDVTLKLNNNDFTTLEERKALFAQAMELSLQDNVRMWLADKLSWSPLKSNISVSYDLSGGIAGGQLWPYTIRYTDAEGGVIRIAQPGILVDPWNPVAGSNWIYDMMPIRATADFGVVNDPYTGLVWPQRIESAAVTVQEGLPVGKTLDWLTLDFAPSIEIPGDTWVDWDATNQKWITAAEKFTQTQTARSKVVVTYPGDLFEKMTWHDGSPLSLADFVMFMIMSYDTGKAESKIFDDAAKANLDTFMSHFKGIRITSTNPLTIESYDDTYFLDAELMVRSWYPMYTYGPGAWHNIGVGVLAEEKKLLAFSADKADALQVEWMSYVAGPSLEILKAELDGAQARNTLLYTPTMSAYVTPEESQARWDHLRAFYGLQGHFWIGTGPMQVDKAFPVEATLTLNRYRDYPDLADKWLGFGTPKIPVVEVDGPGQLAIGAEGVYDVFITFADAPYASADIAGVKYLIFDATGAAVATGEAVLAEEGHYTVTLATDLTGKLTAGSNKVEIVVTSKVVSIPIIVDYEFVTQ